MNHSCLLNRWTLTALQPGKHLRGDPSGFWINVIAVGIAQIAILYGLIIPLKPQLSPPLGHSHA
jgi:hypothetical protein